MHHRAQRNNVRWLKDRSPTGERLGGVANGVGDDVPGDVDRRRRRPIQRHAGSTVVADCHRLDSNIVRLGFNVGHDAGNLSRYWNVNYDRTLSGANDDGPSPANAPPTYPFHLA